MAQKSYCDVCGDEVPEEEIGDDWGTAFAVWVEKGRVSVSFCSDDVACIPCIIKALQKEVE